MTDECRPRYHFTAPQGWLNDPNGLLYHEGEYHLFYQHNPYGTAWGHMSWGHAVSPDLVHWRHLPIALREEREQGYTIFSGSAVLDQQNTSGLGGGEPPMVAIYTAHHDAGTVLEDVHIASSVDRGRTFTQYPGNPVIHVGDAKFGDPKVLWHAETGRWIMATILGNVQGRVVLYGSHDLITWERLDEFHAPEEAPGVWECPDLFPLAVDGDPQRVRWVLKCNTKRKTARPGGDWWAWYVLGRFDGRTFQSDCPAGRRLWRDPGGLYAEMTYNGIPPTDGRRILVGWIRMAASERRDWTGALSLPRVVTLRSGPGGPQICQTPIVELEGLRREHIALGGEPLGRTVLSLSESGLVESEVEMLAEIEPGSARELGLRMRAGAGQAVVGYDAGRQVLFVDRTGEERLAAPLLPQSGRLRLHLFLDRSILEVFGGHGESTLTALLEPRPAAQDLELYALGGEARLVRLDAWTLAPA